MKKFGALIIAGLLLLIAAGCSDRDKHDPPAQADPAGPPAGPGPALAGAGVSDLMDSFDALDPSNASLTCHHDTERTYPASAAIRAGSYLEKLQALTWQPYTPASTADGPASFSYRLTSPDVTITVFSERYDQACPLHLVTDHTEGWFTLPFIPGEENGPAAQASSAVLDIFSSWYEEAETASRCKGTGVPLTPEGLDALQAYTESVRMEHDAYGGYPGGITEIGCFFTSLYDTVEDLDFQEFMRYFPADADDLAPITDQEFQALKKLEDWPFAQVASLSEMPVPIHKYPRSKVDGVLTRYAGITTADLDTAGVAYLKEYDSYYNFTSDFGPGTFIPRYGEKSGDTVVLWETPAGADGSARMLTLRKSGEHWHILSHQAVQAAAK